MSFWKRLSIAVALPMLAPALSWAQSASHQAAFDQKKVIQFLEEGHGSAWQAVIHTSEDRTQLYEILRELAQPALDPARLSLQQSHLAGRALEEMGKFAVEPTGQLRSGAAEFLRTAVTQPPGEDSSLHVRALSSLANASTPETAMMLLEQLPERRIDADDLPTLRGLDRVFNPTAPSQAEKMDRYDLYNPNVGLPLSGRMRPDDWKAVAESALQKLTRLSQNPDLAPWALEAVRKARASAASLLGAELPQEATNTHAEDEKIKIISEEVAAAAAAAPQSPETSAMSADEMTSLKPDAGEKRELSATNSEAPSPVSAIQVPLLALVGLIAALFLAVIFKKS
jgi:hypothetical protein